MPGQSDVNKRHERSFGINKIRSQPCLKFLIFEELDQIHEKITFKSLSLFRLKSLKTRLNVFLNVFREGDWRGRLSSGIKGEREGRTGFYRRFRLSQAACFVVFAFVCFLWIARVENEKKILLSRSLSVRKIKLQGTMQWEGARRGMTKT